MYFTPYKTKSDQASFHSVRIKSIVTFSCIGFIFLVIVCKLFYLQILRGDYFFEEASNNSTYAIFESNAPRGIIYDRTGKVLASNKQYNSLIVIPSILFQHKNNLPKIYRLLSLILGKDKKEIEKIVSHLNKHDAKPTVLVKDLNLEQVASIYERSFELPGIYIQHQSTRFYPYGELFAHSIGYTGQVNDKELKEHYNLKLNDVVGKFGLEKVMDKYLRGERISQRIRINRHGQPRSNIDIYSLNDSLDYNPGTNIKLTLDADLQKTAFDALGKLKGAVVMVVPHTGEVLVLASTPSFDPNIFTSSISKNTWNQFVSSKLFLNRAISGFTPGSIWKPTVLLAALEKGIVNEKTKLWVSDAYYIGRYRFGDWTPDKAYMNMKTALAWSRDTAFYQISDSRKDKHISEVDITYWAKKVGAGDKTGLELEGENTGLVPDKKWQKENLQGIWNPGNTLHYSIGQGYVLFTPAQAARMISFYANNGKLPTLRLVKGIGTEEINQKLYPLKNVKFTPKHLKLVQEGMIQCVDSGTCIASKFPSFQAAGKTGSAEAPPLKKTHAWFVVYAPVKNPQVAVAVFAEGAGHGGSVAAPIAKKVLTKYFEKYDPELLHPK